MERAEWQDCAHCGEPTRRMVEEDATGPPSEFRHFDRNVGALCERRRAGETLPTDCADCGGPTRSVKDGGAWVRVHVFDRDRDGCGDPVRHTSRSAARVVSERRESSLFGYAVLASCGAFAGAVLGSLAGGDPAGWIVVGIVAGGGYAAWRSA